MLRARGVHVERRIWTLRRFACASANASCAARSCAAAAAYAAVASSSACCGTSPVRRGCARARGRSWRGRNAACAAASCASLGRRRARRRASRCRDFRRPARVAICAIATPSTRLRERRRVGRLLQIVGGLRGGDLRGRGGDVGACLIEVQRGSSRSRTATDLALLDRGRRRGTRSSRGGPGPSARRRSRSPRSSLMPRCRRVGRMREMTNPATIATIIDATMTRSGQRRNFGRLFKSCARRLRRFFVPSVQGPFLTATLLPHSRLP